MGAGIGGDEGEKRDSGSGRGHLSETEEVSKAAEGTKKVETNDTLRTNKSFFVRTVPGGQLLCSVRADLDSGW